jgi:hypothetical protein
MFRLVFENLPIFGFQEIMPQLKGKQRLIFKSAEPNNSGDCRVDAL